MGARHTEILSWNGDEHDGTKWVPAGQGATVDDLLDAYCTKVGWWDRGHIADSVWKLHMDANEGDRTNLALTGHPLNAADLERIAECEVERPRPLQLDGCTCGGGIGSTGSHEPSCQWGARRIATCEVK